MFRSNAKMIHISKLSLCVIWLLIDCIYGYPWMKKNQISEEGYQVLSPDGLYSCATLAKESSCKFYSCLDEHINCYSNAYTGSFGDRLCHQEKNPTVHWSAKGRLWAENTNQCLTERILEHLETKSVPCGKSAELIQEIFEGCAMENGLCSILWRERHNLIETASQQVWLSLIAASRSCQRQKVDQFVFWSLRHFGILRS